MPIDIEKDDLQTAIKKLKARENAFRELESMTKLGSWEVDLKTKKSIWSEQSYINYGYEPYSIEPTLDLFLSHILPEDLQRAKDTIQELMQTGKVLSFKCRLKKESGEVVSLLMYGQVVYDEHNEPFKLIGTTQDITNEVKLKEKSDELSKLIENSANEIYIVDFKTNKYLYANKGACKAIGYTLDEILKLTIFDTNIGLKLENVDGMKKLYNNSHKPIIYKSKHIRKDGTTYFVQAYIHSMIYEGRESFVIFDTDITKMVEAQEHIQKQNEELDFKEYYDKLTSLPNRTLLQDRLSQAIVYANKHHQKFALLYIDLDQFKKINDSIGHDTGDEILINISKKIRSSIHSEDTVARLGGDEFAIILNNVLNIQSISSVATRIIEIIKEPIIINEQPLYVTASLGVSLFPDDSKDAHDLRKFADIAMYKAKDDGRNNFQFYSSEMTQIAFEKVLMENNIRMALERNEFVVYYQPQYDARDDSLVGMEALVRWQHPAFGIIPPAKFLSVADESGLLVDIDKLVRKDAMKQFSIWYKDGLNPGKLSLNLTTKQLDSKNFMYNLLKVMADIKFDKFWLDLEILETHIMDNPEKAIDRLNKIHDLGIKISIDDFGTGYSSLSYLKKLPIDKLKIDRSFVMDIPNDEDDMVITKTIIALAKSLNINLIAEGVEDIDQKEFLLKNGCNYIQGYIYSKPISAKDMTNLLKKELNK